MYSAHVLPTLLARVHHCSSPISLILKWKAPHCKDYWHGDSIIRDTKSISAHRGMVTLTTDLRRKTRVMWPGGRSGGSSWHTIVTRMMVREGQSWQLSPTGGLSAEQSVIWAWRRVWGDWLGLQCHPPPLRGLHWSGLEEGRVPSDKYIRNTEYWNRYLTWLLKTKEEAKLINSL